MRSCIRDDRMIFRIKAARNPDDISDDVLRYLMTDPLPEVRAKLAERASDPDILDTLSHDRSAMVRKSVAENVRTPSEILERLSYDRSEMVLAFTVRNPGTPVRDRLWLTLFKSSAVSMTSENLINFLEPGSAEVFLVESVVSLLRDNHVRFPNRKNFNKAVRIIGDGENYLDLLDALVRFTVPVDD